MTQVAQPTGQTQSTRGAAQDHPTLPDAGEGLARPGAHRSEGGVADRTQKKAGADRSRRLQGVRNQWDEPTSFTSLRARAPTGEHDEQVAEANVAVRRSFDVQLFDRTTAATRARIAHAFPVTA